MRPRRTSRQLSLGESLRERPDLSPPLGGLQLMMMRTEEVLQLVMLRPPELLQLVMLRPPLQLVMMRPWELLQLVMLMP